MLNTFSPYHLLLLHTFRAFSGLIITAVPLYIIFCRLERRCGELNGQLSLPHSLYPSHVTEHKHDTLFRTLLRLPFCLFRIHFLFLLVFCYSYSLSAVFLWRNKRHTWIKLDLEPPKWPLMRNLFLPVFYFFFFLYCSPQRNGCRCFQGTPAKQKEIRLWAKENKRASFW